jgi:hypothetical protein
MTATVAMLGERALRRLGVVVVAVTDLPPLTVTVPAATIATAALVELGVIASDETPTATDQALALAKVNSVHDSLVVQGLVSWTLNVIPQAVAEEYTKLTALIMATSFGKTAGDLTVHAALEARVRKASLIMGALDIAMGAVMSVHYELVARDMARWSIFDVPLGAEDPYVALAAAALAPQFGMKPIDGDMQLAYRTLARIIALPTSGERTPAEYF